MDTDRKLAAQAPDFSYGDKPLLCYNKNVVGASTIGGELVRPEKTGRFEDTRIPRLQSWGVCQRNINMDIARGIGIVAVSIYHLVYRSQDGIFDKLIKEFVWLFIPFCFLISGFNLKKRTFAQNVKHRFKNSFLPASILIALWFLIGGIYCAFVHGYSFMDWFRDLIYTYLRPEFSGVLFSEWGKTGVLYENISAVWFVWAMIFASVLFYLIADKIRINGRNTIYFGAISIFISVMLYDFGNKISWSLTLVPLYAAIMFCGAYLSLSKFQYRPNIILAVIAIIIHAAMFHFNDTDLVFMNVVGQIGKWSVIPFFVQIFIGGYALMTFSKLLNDKCGKLSKIFAFIGENSLSFLLLHCAFGMILADLMHTYIKPGENWYVPLTPEIVVKSLIGWFVSLILCYVVCKLKRNFDEK